MVVDDADGKIIYANQTFCSIVGYDANEITQHNSIEFWDDESKKKIQEVDKTVRSKGESSTYECTLVSKKGNTIPVLVSGAPRENGGSVGIITDLTKIKEQEAKLTRFSNAISRSHDAHILLDMHGKILIWNTGAKEIFELPEDQARKQTIQSISNNTIQLPKDQHYISEETQINKGGNETIWIAYTIEKTDNERDKYLCIVRDITHTKKMQKHLQERYAKMQSAINEFGIIRRKMDYFYDLHKAVQSSKDLREFGQFIASSIRMISNAHSCIVQTRSKSHLKILATYGLHQDWWGQKKISLNTKIVQSTFATGITKIFDVSSSQDLPSKKLLKKNGITSMMLFGLSFRNVQIGMITIHMDDTDQWSVFEDPYLVDYVHAVEVCLGAYMRDFSE